MKIDQPRFRGRLARPLILLLRILRNRKTIMFLLLLCVTAMLALFTSVPFIPHFRLTSPKYVIVLGANHGGGVQQWKSGKDWELEKLSIANKKAYAERHGYNIVIKDMTMQKKYSQEWREAWQMVDVMREAMRQFPSAEWFWWIDLNSYIMEPQRSLDEVLFGHLDKLDRDCNLYNPANMDLDLPFVDYSQDISMVLSQDCAGFSLGSWFLKRGQWSDLLLDLLWDPAFYGQKYPVWSHVEQSAVEYFYNTQPWIRSGTAFAPQTDINAYPRGACGGEEPDNTKIFYRDEDRNFLVNLAGCSWGRDCWAEMQEFEKKAKANHRNRFLLF